MKHKKDRIMQFRTLATIAIWAAATVFTVPTATLAAQYQFTTLDHPSAGNLTNAYDINNDGDVVGYYGPGTNGYVYSGGVWTDTEYPGGLDTNNHSINNTGLVGGYYYETGQWPPFHGYIYNGTTFTPDEYPGADKNAVHGINDASETVGWAWVPGGNPWPDLLGYYHHDGSWDVLEDPDGGTVYPEALNDSGHIVGGCFQSGAMSGFVLDNGSWTFYEHPDANGYTLFNGVNEAGLIVGMYRTGDSFPTWEYHGFTFDGTEFSNISVPWENTSSTICHGVNDFGHIVGTYVTDADGVTHGFVAVPEPCSLLLMGLGASAALFGKKRGLAVQASGIT